MKHQDPNLETPFKVKLLRRWRDMMHSDTCGLKRRAVEQAVDSLSSTQRPSPDLLHHVDASLWDSRVEATQT